MDADPIDTTGRHPWIEAFVQAPAEKLDRLLRGGETIAPYYRADAADILCSLIAPAPRPDPVRDVLDGALLDWIKERRAETPDQRLTFGVGRFVGKITLAFSIVGRLGLTRTARHLAADLDRYDGWARSLDMGIGYAPWWELMRAVAEDQVDGSLQPLWLRLADQAGLEREEERSDRLLSLALVSARKLPQPEPNPDAARLHAVLEVLAAFARHLPDTKAARQRFLGHLRSLQRQHPTTPTLWKQASRPLIEGLKVHADGQTTDAPAAAWWREEVKVGEATTTARALSPVPMDRWKPLLQAVSRSGVGQMEGSIMGLVTESIRYAEYSGDGYFLVRTCSNFARAVLNDRPDLALYLIRTGRTWEPSNPFLWSLWGKALAQLGWPDLAETIYWESIRRFPDNVVCRAALGTLLAGQGRVVEAEALYRETMAAFPENSVCINQYGLMLVNLGRAAEARALLPRLRALFGAERALAELEAAIRRGPYSPSVKVAVTTPTTPPDYRPDAAILRTAELARHDFALGPAFDRLPDEVAPRAEPIRTAAWEGLDRLVAADPSDPLAALIRHDRTDGIGQIGEGLFKAFPHDYGLHSLAALNSPDRLSDLTRRFGDQVALNACMRLAVGIEPDLAAAEAARFLSGERPPVDLRQRAVRGLFLTAMGAGGDAESDGDRRGAERRVSFEQARELIDSAACVDAMRAAIRGASRTPPH